MTANEYGRDNRREKGDLLSFSPSACPCGNGAEVPPLCPALRLHLQSAGQKPGLHTYARCFDHHFPNGIIARQIQPLQPGLILPILIS